MTAANCLDLSVVRGAEVRQLREMNEKLRAKLLELAKDCVPCSGTGCVDVVLKSPLSGRLHSVSEDCPVCLDIRELL